MAISRLAVHYEPAPEAPPLVAAGRYSFRTSPHELNSVCSWLIQLGYTERPPTSQYEHARFIDRGAIIVIYASGSIVCQGSEQERAAQLLRRASIQQSTLALEWPEVQA